MTLFSVGAAAVCVVAAVMSAGFQDAGLAALFVALGVTNVSLAILGHRMGVST